MTALAILFALAFFTLLLSRVHFHFSFNLTISRSSLKGPATIANPAGERARGRRRDPAVTMEAAETASQVRSIRDSGVQKTLETARAVAEGEVASALVNLGCDKQKAREVARKAIEQGKDFESRVRWAIQNAA